MDDFFADDAFDPALFEQVDRIVDQHKRTVSQEPASQLQQQPHQPPPQPQQQVHPLYGPLKQAGGGKRPALQVQARPGARRGHISPGVFGPSPSPPAAAARPPPAQENGAAGPSAELVRQHGSLLRDRLAGGSQHAAPAAAAAAAAAAEQLQLSQEGPRVSGPSNLLRAQLKGYADPPPLATQPFAGPTAAAAGHRTPARPQLGSSPGLFGEPQRQLQALEQSLAFKEQELLEERRRAAETGQRAKGAEGQAAALQERLRASEAQRAQLQQELEAASRERRARQAERLRSGGEAGPSPRPSQAASQQPSPRPASGRLPGSQAAAAAAAEAGPSQRRAVATSPAQPSGGAAAESAAGQAHPWQLPWLPAEQPPGQAPALAELLEVAAQHFAAAAASPAAAAAAESAGVWQQVQQLARGEACGPALLVSLARSLPAGQAALREEGGGAQLLGPLLLLPPLLEACPVAAQLAAASCREGPEGGALEGEAADRLWELRRLGHHCEAGSGLLGLLLQLQAGLNARREAAGVSHQPAEAAGGMQAALLAALRALAAAEAGGPWLAACVSSGLLEGLAGEQCPALLPLLLPLLRALLQSEAACQALAGGGGSGSAADAMEVDGQEDRGQASALLDLPLLCLAAPAVADAAGDSLALRPAGLAVVADLLLRRRGGELQALCHCQRAAPLGSALLGLLAEAWEALCAGGGEAAERLGGPLRALQEALLLLLCLLRVGPAAGAVSDDLAGSAAAQRQSLTLLARIGAWLAPPPGSEAAWLAPWVPALGHRFIGRECYAPSAGGALLASAAEAQQLAASIRRRLLKRMQG